MYRGPVEDVTMSTAASLARVMRQRSLLVLLLFGVFATAYGRSPDDTELVAGLQGGGYVIVMRHVSSPRIPPDQAHADSDNSHRNARSVAARKDNAAPCGGDEYPHRHALSEYQRSIYNRCRAARRWRGAGLSPGRQGRRRMCRTHKNRGVAQASSQVEELN